MKQITFIWLAILMFIAYSCEEQAVEKKKETLSLKGLEKVLESNPDFADYITLSINSFVKTDEILNSMSSEEWDQLKTIYSKYSNYLEFESNTSSTKRNRGNATCPT